ncbi:MAG TPA: MerR family transcriptional regulator, partial [Kofleriaceae bacterium]|nr:MerR family transcriptional regulator [Kofleriaceae bacterium]
FKIGEFSRFTRVTVKMLRYYDEIGLLRPSHVEPATGYRYYMAEQLPELNRILALKDLGFPLDAIAVLRDESRSREEKAALFRERRSELERSIQREAARLRQLDALQAGSAGLDQDRHDVVLRAVPSCRMATIRRRVAALYGSVTAMFEELEAHVAAHRARASASPLLLLHDEEYREADLELESAVPLTRPVPETADIRVREVEGCPTMACVIYRGGYDQTGGVLQTLLAWTELHGMRIAGPVREVYLRFGADQRGYRLPSGFLAGTASEFVTEVQLPLVEGET